jgi:hypothetical protein
MYDGLDGVVFPFCSIPDNALQISLSLLICSIPQKDIYLHYIQGCLDSYHAQCRLEAFAVPMFCFLLQNTTEAKSY